MSTLTEEQLATLTPEERAAVSDTEYSPEELAAMQGIIEEDAGHTADPDDDDDGEPDPAAATAPKTPEPAKVDADPAADTTPAKPEPAAKADDAPFIPAYKAEAPADFDDRIKEINTQEATLKAQFKDGTLDFDEYEDKRSEFILQREELNRQRTKAEVSTEMQAQTQDQLWQRSVASALNRYAAEDGGIDYRKDAVKAADLDLFVKSLAQKPENADKSMDWFLDEANKRVKALHGLEAPKPADPSADPAARRKPPIGAAPKTLAQVPGSDGPGDVDGEFANLDRLEGEQLEAAIAKMTPAQRERYARQ